MSELLIKCILTCDKRKNGVRVYLKVTDIPTGEDVLQRFADGEFDHLYCELDPALTRRGIYCSINSIHWDTDAKVRKGTVEDVSITFEELEAA